MFSNSIKKLINKLKNSSANIKQRGYEFNTIALGY